MTNGQKKTCFNLFNSCIIFIHNPAKKSWDVTEIAVVLLYFDVHLSKTDYRKGKKCRAGT